MVVALDGSPDGILGWPVTLLRGVYGTWIRRGGARRLVGGAQFRRGGKQVGKLVALVVSLWGTRCCGNGCSGHWRWFRAAVEAQPVWSEERSSRSRGRFFVF